MPVEVSGSERMKRPRTGFSNCAISTRVRWQVQSRSGGGGGGFALRKVRLDISSALCNFHTFPQVSGASAPPGTSRSRRSVFDAENVRRLGYSKKCSQKWLPQGSAVEREGVG